MKVKVNFIPNKTLVKMVRDLNHYNKSIIEGRSASLRHRDFFKDAKSRKDLDYNVPMGQFTDDQHDVVIETLKGLKQYLFVMNKNFHDL